MSGPHPALSLLFWAGVFLNTAHVFSPIVLTWTHPELRRTALREWDWYIVVPLGAFALAMLLPTLYVTLVYGIWNVWHFGTQNYGLACLRWRLRRRWGWKAGFIGGTASGMSWDGSLLGSGASSAASIVGPFTLFHGASDLWLSWSVTPRRTLFIGLAIALSFTGLAFASPSLRHMLPWLIAARMGLGFVHFLYSRMVPWGALWRRGNPIMAAA